MKRRIFSAAVGIPVVLLAIWGGVLGAGFLSLIAGVAGGSEIGAMAKVKWRISLLYIAPFIIMIGTSIAVAELDPVAISSDVLVGGAALLSVLFVITGSFLVRRQGGGLGWIAALASLYFAFTLAHVPAIVDLEAGRNWLLLALFGTFANDTGAFFIGKRFGRIKLAPAISPRKTWEGFIGGLLVSMAVVVGLVELLDLGTGVAIAVGLGAVIACVATVGDLGESWFKRKADVKHSGIVIPGHGGILDRVDSLAPVFVVVYLASLWVSRANL